LKGLSSTNKISASSTSRHPSDDMSYAASLFLTFKLPGVCRIKLP
jgi:hypothetical protein